jgi:hypothetical protein
MQDTKFNVAERRKGFEERYSFRLIPGAAWLSPIVEANESQ